MRSEPSRLGNGGSIHIYQQSKLDSLIRKQSIRIRSISVTMLDKTISTKTSLELNKEHDFTAGLQIEDVLFEIVIVSLIDALYIMQMHSANPVKFKNLLLWIFEQFNSEICFSSFNPSSWFFSFSGSCNSILIRILYRLNPRSKF